MNPQIERLQALVAQLIARLEHERSESRRLASQLASREAELAQTKHLPQRRSAALKENVMPEVTVNIYSRSYRLAVSTGEEALIQRCADIVDKQMKAIREGGKVINQDQIAVLAALEVAYEANKNVQKNSTDAQRSAAEKDAEIARLKARIAELESRPAPVAAPLQASGPDAETTEAIERLCRQCEQAIYANMSRGAVL